MYKEETIKELEIIMYVTDAVTKLNSTYPNIIPEEKFFRAIRMFTNMDADINTIKSTIDWHVENETKQYLERQQKIENFNAKKLSKKR